MLNTPHAWQAECTKGDLDLVLPAGDDSVAVCLASPQKAIALVSGQPVLSRLSIAFCPAYTRVMKRLACALVIILSWLAAPVAAGQSRCFVMDPMRPNQWAADPATLAAAWLPEIKRLYEAIPFLSPQEEQWLKEETVNTDGNRYLSAMASQEYAVQESKLRVGGHLTLVRRLMEAHDREAQTRDLLWLAHALIDNDTALYLARLEAKRVIRREAIPWYWKFFAEGKGGATLQEAMRWGRGQLAQHVIACALPSVLGVSMEPLPWQTNPAIRAR